jgi:EAL domain-containing protein (putative c-di-GMP-specific phosphodiesterase class I)
MSSHSEKRLDLELKLHQALEKNEFQLHYQPQIDTANNKIVAAEALIRWQQSELGMVYPDDFISLAEETGQIFKIGEWVINEACRQNKAWQLAGLEPIRIAVNLSSLQFMQEGLCQTIADILQKNQLKPEYLELEITESIMMRNIDQTISIIHELSEMGINVSVDDFGTGYSSLSYLKKFPLESLKIDKSFVLDIPEDKDDMMITSAIISMAKSLNLKVVAEGVESAGQVEFLKEHQCDMMQGYYFSRPVTADNFAILLAKLYFD